MIFSRDHVRKGDLQYQKGNLRRAAELYLKAKRFRKAAGVYAELGEIDRAVEIFVEGGELQAAGELLQEKGRPKEAIVRFEEAGAYERAADLCLQVHQVVRAGRLFEQAEMFRRAAECFAKAGEIEHALRAWEREAKSLRTRRGSNRDHGLEREIRELDLHRADILANFGRFLEAAELLAEHGAAARAAPLYERAGDWAAAAQAHVAAGKVERALTAVGKATDIDDEVRAEIYLSCSRHREAAEIFERMGRHGDAASACEGAEAWAQAAVLWEKADAPDRAAEFFSQVGRFQDAGRCYALADEHEKAASAFAQAGNHQGAADAYSAAGDHLRAGSHYLEAGLARAARDSLQGIRAASPDRAQASLLLIPLLLDDGLVDAARDRFEALPKDDDELDEKERLYCQARIEEAMSRYSAAEVLYRRVLAGRQGFRDAGQRLRDIRGKVDEPEPPPEQGDPLRDTAPVVFEPPASTAGSGPARFSSLPTPPPSAPADRYRSVLPLPNLADSASLPFDFQDRVDPWWDGAEFFRAVDRRSGRAILLVSFPLAVVGSLAEGFRQAMREIVALNQPTILKLDEAIIASDKVLLLYEPFEGRTLASVLAEEGAPAPTTSLYLIVQLCEALTSAHKLGITHQWLSPRTVLLDEHSRVKLVGVGMREVLAHRDDTSRSYLGPEVQSGGMVGPASDVYSLAKLALELLEARMPEGWAQREALEPDTVSWPEEVRQRVAKPLRSVLVRALARDPLARPSTAELVATLSSIGLMRGQILVDRYEILEQIGRGGMSRVYKARDRELDDEVAIKTVLTPALGHSENEERLVREVQICRKISHPNVVRVHDIGRFPGGIFVIMELLEGPGLDLVIQHETPMAEARVRRLLLEIAAALGEAHRLKIVHRDLKPSNVILIDEEDDRVKVLDFGIARMSDGSTGELTRTGEVIGSPMYMAPEQIQGQPLTGACDLYALGIIAFALLTGREPFTGETTTAVVLKHLHEPPPDVRKRRPDLPEPWVDLLERLLAKTPNDRFASARELIRVLEALPV